MVIQPLRSGDDPETELVQYQTTAEKRAQKTHVTWVVGPQKQDGNEEAGIDCLTLLILHFSRLHRVCGDTETFKRQLMGMTLALVEDLYPLVRAARVRVPPLARPIALLAERRRLQGGREPVRAPALVAHLHARVRVPLCVARECAVVREQPAGVGDDAVREDAPWGVVDCAGCAGQDVPVRRHHTVAVWNGSGALCVTVDREGTCVW